MLETISDKTSYTNNEVLQSPTFSVLEHKVHLFFPLANPETEKQCVSN